MNSDLAQSYYLNTADAEPMQDETLELSRMQSFIDGDEDIFDVLAHKSIQERRHTKDSKAMDTQLDLINATKNKLFMSRQRHLLKGYK